MKRLLSIVLAAVLVLSIAGSVQAEELQGIAKGFAGEDFRWGCFAYSTVENGVNGAETANYSAQVLAVNAQSLVANEAFQLISYLTKGQPDKTMSAMSFGVPADTANNEWPAMIQEVMPVMEAATSRWTWAAGIESNEDLTPFIRENVQKLCGGTITAEQFVENMLVASGR